MSNANDVLFIELLEIAVDLCQSGPILLVAHVLVVCRSRRRARSPDEEGEGHDHEVGPMDAVTATGHHFNHPPREVGRQSDPWPSTGPPRPRRNGGSPSEVPDRLLSLRFRREISPSRRGP